MKVWQKILLQTGIFTSVFALGAGTGFLCNYHYEEDEAPTSQGVAIVVTEPDTPHIETPTERFLNSLVTAKALEGNIDLQINKANDVVPEGVKRGIKDLDVGEIELSISNLQVSIADIDNIKVAGDINLKMGKLDIDLSVGYFDNTIYLDYADTHFFLKTDDITDVMDMLPTFGVNLEVPSEFSNLDFDALTGSLANMEEHKENGEHYFLFQFNEDIAIKLLSDDEYNMVGVELPSINLMGMNISAQSDIHPLTEDIETLINPSLKEDGPQYTEFKPAFRLINDVMDLVNAKAARVDVDLDLNKLNSNNAYESFLRLDATLDFDINDLALAADLCVTYANKPYSLRAAYLDETIYASYKNINLSIQQQSVLSLVEYLSTKISNDKLDEVMNKLGSISDEIDFDTILTLVNDLPQFIQNFKLTNNSLSFTFVPSYFNLDASAFDLAVTFNDTSVTGLSLKGLEIGEYEINVNIDIKPYVQVEVNSDDYLAIDPALSLIGSIEKLIKQDKFGVSFTVKTDDGNDETNDLYAEGNFNFALRDKTDAEFESHMIKTTRTFDYGAGELTILDGDAYPHNIKVDAQQYTEEMAGKVLFSYGGTTNKRTNARIDYATFDSLVDRVLTLFQDKDPHIMELFGDMIESTESSPLALILSSKNISDYVQLLDYDIITYLDITPSEVTVGINGELIGMDEMNPLITIRYTEDSLSGLDISGINLGGKSVEISANLSDFDEETYNYYRQAEDSSYIDLSTVSVLVEQALKTAELNYWHARGTIDFNIDTAVIGAIADAMIGTLVADVQISNDNAHTTVAANLKNIPCINVPVVNLFVETCEDYHSGMSRESTLIFDNGGVVDVGNSGIFHINRHDTWSETNLEWNGIIPSLVTTNYTQDLYSKYDTPTMVANIMPILLKDVLGLGSTITNSVSNIESAGGQIHYESIIENYEYEKLNSFNNEYYHSNDKVDKYSLSINIGELAHSDSLKTLTLTLYGEGDMLFGVDVDLTLTAGLDMSLTMKMYLQSDYSANPVSDLRLTNGMLMSEYSAAHENDPMNARAPLVVKP